MCRAVFKFQGELLQGQCLHAQAHGPRQRRGEIPPQPTSADKPMSNGTWRQDQLPAAALAARRPIRIEGSASAQAVKAQWLCTCYTWPGSNWRPSACEADVIATRPQVLVTVVLLDCYTVCSRGQPETPPIYPEHASIMCGAVTGDRLLLCMGKCQCTRAAATGSHDPQLR